MSCRWVERGAAAAGVFAVVAWAGACAPGGGSGGGSGGASAASAAAASIGTGPLAQKAALFEQTMQASHVPFGLVQDVRFDASGAVVGRGGPSRCLWTGVYAAAQAMRYRATGDGQALAAMEAALWALHDLHAVTGQPGVIARGLDLPHYDPHGFDGQGAYQGLKYDKGETSRDQYTGWFYGIAFAFDEVRDPALRSALVSDVRAVADHLLREGLAIKALWGGQPVTFFNLNPDYAYQDKIDPVTWATVDDFPINLFTQAVPYDPQLAQALRSITFPPIRAGEAMRALMMLTVAAKVTGDPRYAAEKDALLYGPRGFGRVVADFFCIIEDALHGENLVAVRAALLGVAQTIGQVIDIYMQVKNVSPLVRLLVVAAMPGIGQWLADRAVDVVDYLTDPNSQAKLQRIAAHAQTAATVLGLLGLGGAAQQVQGFLSTYGQSLHRDGLAEAADALRSYVGLNLGNLAFAAAVHCEPDAQTRDRYRQAFERQWRYVADEEHAFLNLIHARFGLAPGPSDVGDARLSLERFETDLRLRRVDNSFWPGLRVSPWPDRFGRVGNLAAGPVFPIDRREHHLFVWQSNPRTIVDGRDAPDHEVAPLGYLAPYWLAREMGALGPAD